LFQSPGVASPIINKLAGLINTMALTEVVVPSSTIPLIGKVWPKIIFAVLEEKMILQLENGGKVAQSESSTVTTPFSWVADKSADMFVMVDAELFVTVIEPDDGAPATSPKGEFIKVNNEMEIFFDVEAFNEKMQ